MGKKSKLTTTQLVKRESEEPEEKSDGCVSPTGCVVGTPIDRSNPGDAIRMLCSNDTKCTEVLFVHAKCFEKLEDMLLRWFEAQGNRNRGGTWTDQQKVASLWNKKGYEVLFKYCRCPCTGFLRKDIDYRPPQQAQANNEAGNAETKKPKPIKTAVEKVLPKLQKPNGYKKLTRINSAACTTESPHADQPSDDSYIPGLYVPPPPQSIKSTEYKPRTLSPVQKKSALVSRRRGSFQSVGNCSLKSYGSEEQPEIATVDELMSIIDTVLPNGQYPLVKVEDRVNNVLQYATVDILSGIADYGGFWPWICSDDDGPDATFKIMLDNGFITKASRECPNGEVRDEDDNEQEDSEDDDASGIEPAPGSILPTASSSNDQSMTIGLRIDDDLRRAVEAHSFLPLDFNYTGSIYSESLEKVRLMAREMGITEYW